MKKELKDYLHFYLEHNVICFWDSTNPAIKPVKAILCTESHNRHGFISLAAALTVQAKPILRPISDMTEEEVIKLVYKRSTVYLNVSFKSVRYGGVNFEFEYASSKRRRWETQKMSDLNPEQFRYLLSIGIDLFELIPAGLAFDKTTLKQSQELAKAAIN